MPTQQISNSFVVEIGGQPLPADVDVSAVVVDDHLKLPDSFHVTMRDAARSAITKSGAAIGGAIKISVKSDASPQPQPLIVGEITALEAEIHGGTSFTVIRGYDQSHRLFRGRPRNNRCDWSYPRITVKLVPPWISASSAVISPTINGCGCGEASDFTEILIAPPIAAPDLVIAERAASRIVT